MLVHKIDIIRLLFSSPLLQVLLGSFRKCLLQLQSHGYYIIQVLTVPATIHKNDSVNSVPSSISVLHPPLGGAKKEAGGVLVGGEDVLPSLADHLQLGVSEPHLMHFPAAQRT